MTVRRVFTLQPAAERGISVCLLGFKGVSTTEVILPHPKEEIGNDVNNPDDASPFFKFNLYRYVYCGNREGMEDECKPF